MKPYDYYSMKGVPYPTKTQFTTIYVYKTGKVIWQGSVAEFDEYKKNLEGAGVVEQAVDSDSYHAALDAYCAEQGKRQGEFRTDLFEDHCVLGHPKADKCFNLAWELWHSDGYQEIAYYFDRLVELIKE